VSVTVLLPTDDGAPPVEGRPLPELDGVSTEWWNAAARGELLYQECPSCGHRQFYPRAMCTACGLETEWKPASGRGSVHTFTVIHQNLAAPFGDLSPYVVAMVELEEGVRMMTNITHCDKDEVEVGLPVECYVVKVDDEVGLPFWRPAKS
jgi:uncharacterized OB-fold protein